MKKKIISTFICMSLVTASMLTGCGGSSDKAETAATEKKTEASTEETKAENEETKEATEGMEGTDADTDNKADATGNAEEVSIWYYWEAENHQKALDKVIQDYNESQDEIQVTAKYVPFADFKKQLSIGASANELPDIAILDSPDHASYASMDIFSDLTGKFDVENYYQGAVDSCTIDGALYGVPFGVNCLGLYYNEDMLKEANCEVPETWDELKTTAQALTKDNVTGLAFCSLQNEEGTFNFLPWLWSTGTDSYHIDTDGGVKALTYVKDLVDSGSMSKECINWTQGDVMNQFVSGNVAMMVNGPWQIPPMKQEAPDLNWKVTLIPKDSNYASALGGENYAVISGGNEEGALKFLQYATNEEQVKYLMNEFGYISADKNIAATQFTDDESMKTFTEEMEYAKARGPLAEWPEVSNAISLAFNQVMTGEMEPEDAAASAQASIDSVVVK
ncbi:sugar ABC transporter substrate-binding protein [Robinsoniella sp. KNHs210]|uniref:sugar ABC transporter substrate-binding protein n=1 Tax=Robinsoniella sp. KNHs210 TaxID=1469950 RepID=UPI0005C7E558|nr:ABC transporter substrate-binding protein [Robinsoniella sp. KNHs210]